MSRAAFLTGKNNLYEPKDMPKIKEFALFALTSLIFFYLYASFFNIEASGDSVGYLQISERIHTIFHDQTKSLLDIRENFRILGYPFLLAGLKDFFGANLQMVLHIIQITAVIASAMALFSVLRTLDISLIGSLALSLTYLAALPAFFSSYILTDSIHNALTAVALCLLTTPLLTGSRVSATPLILAGCLMALAFLLREANQYLIVCFIPILLVLLLNEKPRMRALLIFMGFFVPFLVAVEAYKSFNAIRFGERVLTTGGQTVMLQGILSVAKKNPGVFDGDSDLDRIARENLKTYKFADIMQIRQKLHDLGIDGPKLSALAFEKYFETWTRFPVAMTLAVLKRIRLDKQATFLLNPVGATYASARLRNESLPSETNRIHQAFRSGAITDLGIAALFICGHIVSVLIYLAFLIGTPITGILAWRKKQMRLALGLSAFLLFYLGYVLVYALVHVEMRYFGGIAVIPPILAAFSTRYIWPAGRVILNQNR